MVPIPLKTVTPSHDMMLHVQAMLMTLCEVPYISTHALEYNRIRNKIFRVSCVAS